MHAGRAQLAKLLQQGTSHKGQDLEGGGGKDTKRIAAGDDKRASRVIGNKQALSQKIYYIYL